MAITLDTRPAELHDRLGWRDPARVSYLLAGEIDLSLDETDRLVPLFAQRLRELFGREAPRRG